MDFSAAVQRAGFELEGIARKNAMVQGVWEDHAVYVLPGHSHGARKAGQIYSRFRSSGKHAV